MSENEKILSLLNEILAEIKSLKVITTPTKYAIEGVPLRDYLAKNNPKITAGIFYNRLRRGWSVEDAASKPKSNKKTYKYEGLPIKEWLSENNPSVKVSIFHNRLNQGWSVKEAATIPKGDSRYVKIQHEGAYHYAKSGITIKGGKGANIASEGKGRVVLWKNFVNKGEASEEDLQAWKNELKRSKNERK